MITSISGKLFDGDVTARQYGAYIAGGAVAGAGIGVCIGLGAVAATSGAFLWSSTAIAKGSLLAIGAGISAIFGGAGYLVQQDILNEKPSIGDLLINISGNALSGTVGFAGGIIKSMPNNGNVNSSLYSGLKYLGVGIATITRSIINSIKKKLQELF